MPNLVDLDQTVRGYVWRPAGKIGPLASRLWSHSGLSDPYRSATYDFLL